MSEIPLLKVVRGQPDEGELAAVVAALLVLMREGGPAAEAGPRRAEWGSERFRHRAAAFWPAQRATFPSAP
ncbi:acetyl-CoA carboxylase biotin carboxyl carrier protein subunit [Streptomyces sp. V2]|uniref:Acyl-CoA carboxylase epsilon subunit n=1 Tax=Streptomyces niveiscabiei TaxID=164115 RepID=A0ABW9HKS9_9ACTN|nr:MULTISPECIES: acyl-CoA carboxylase epsilon subunit [Streptomyces]MDX3380080.1 acyl-CoA carboxylase epsilon subunit [Streptomyces niveiscabiei]PWG15118.1 acetyl-CoA carboxylase biotin carboxyl carrier protein subunit [Streptomyces sp. V2]QZZ30766.1 acyl-CoA carboxylase subunit epsilon [Streptomyces sp. ST1015]